jgi:hypothetical protein
MKTFIINTQIFNKNKAELDGFVFHRQYDNTHTEVQIACFSRYIRPILQELVIADMI